MSGDESDQSGRLGPKPGGLRPARSLAQEGGQGERRVSRPRAAEIRLGGLDQQTGYVVRRAQLWMVQDFRRLLKLKGLDLTPAQFSVLSIIAANPGLSQARVSEALAIERARLVQMIDNLEAAGRVERTRSTTDRRSHALRLTPPGAEVLERAQACLEAHERNVIARLGARDRGELLRILAPFIE